MKIPERLAPLVEDGLVDAVMRQLMSGKEAMVYVVRCGDDVRCAKVYKEANHRSFRQSAGYTESRKVKNSRRARAMEKGGRYGRKAQEDSWQSAEVAALYRLSAAGVRVPQPYNFADGVLLMELVIDAAGNAAPRLSELALTLEQARAYHRTLLTQIVRMLCAGVVHGDLSEYNVLVSSEGPVIIDLPQAIDAAGNNNACAMFKRDVSNLTAYFARFAPELLTTDYGGEIWSLYENGQLQPQTELTGRFARNEKSADVKSVMREVDAAYQEEAARLRHKQEKGALGRCGVLIVNHREHRGHGEQNHNQI